MGTGRAQIGLGYLVWRVGNWSLAISGGTADRASVFELARIGNAADGAAIRGPAGAGLDRVKDEAEYPFVWACRAGCSRRRRALRRDRWRQGPRGLPHHPQRLQRLPQQGLRCRYP